MEFTLDYLLFPNDGSNLKKYYNIVKLIMGFYKNIHIYCKFFWSNAVLSKIFSMNKCNGSTKIGLF